MKRIIAALAVLVALIGIALVAPKPTTFDGHPTDFWISTPGTVYVQSTLRNALWNRELVTATGFIDGFTGSTEYNHACHTGARCITVRFGKVSGSALGYTSCRHGNCVITVEKTSPVRYQSLLLLHELGHAFGLTHTAHCVSVMYPYRTCWTHLNGRPFTNSEIRALRRA